MKKLIYRLRKQPEETRRGILNITMFILTILLLLLWSYSLGETFSKTKTEEKVKDDLKPFTLLKNNIFKSDN